MAQLIVSGMLTGISQTIQVWSSKVTGVTALGGLGIVWSNGEHAMTKTTDKYTFTFHVVEECEEAIEEIREIIFKTLEDKELRRSFDTPDDDPGPRYEWESPEHAFTRCVAERAANAVLERTTVHKVADGEVSVELREIGHAEITLYNAEIGSLLEYGDRINIDWMPMAIAPRNGAILLLYCEYPQGAELHFGLFDDGKWLEPYVVGYEPLKGSPWHRQGFELEYHCEITGWLPISAKELSAAGFNDNQVAALLEMSRRWCGHVGSNDDRGAQQTTRSYGATLRPVRFGRDAYCDCGADQGLATEIAWCEALTALAGGNRR
jgi:hypothetical protein